MDYRTATSNLIKSYYKFKTSHDVSSFIHVACEYFNAIKDKELSQNEIHFLYFIANEVGIPQYYDLLNIKFNNNNLEIKSIPLAILGSMINDSSLNLNNNVKLHKYQKEILEHFQIDSQNRFVLSAPTSFGKTFLVYQLIEKMKYVNIALIFPTISLLSENYSKILTRFNEETFFSQFTIHTLSDDITLGVKNIWIYTPERFLSYIDKNPYIKFDFIFIDEIYKIDNEYIIDNETTGENERDTAYRIALEYACRTSKDILLAGPYMEIANKGEIDIGRSFSNFTRDKVFEVLNYNDIEIVNKKLSIIKNKLEYDIDGINVKVGKGKYTKVANIIQAITTKNDNTIVYYSTKSGTERYAKQLMPLLNFEHFNCDISENKLYFAFIEHLEKTFGADWVVVEALKLGMGIHHGLIPKYIQKQIIEFFNEGKITVLISTTTITEGVNTTAKNIIVCSDKKGIKSLRHFDAMNIAGRAGRFYHHYTGRVIVINNNFGDIYISTEEALKHKNFDEISVKSEVDYLITDEKYLKPTEKIDKDNMYAEVEERKIPLSIIEQFKVVGIRDKLKIYDRLLDMTYEEQIELDKLIECILLYTNITWTGFQLVLNIICPIVKDKKILQLIERRCQNKEGESSQFSILTAKTYYFLKGGFFDMLNFTLEEKGKSRDEAIRDTADMIYNVFKYQLVKYLGVFDMILKCVISQKTSRPFDDIIGISRLVKKLEYGVLTENARILSDYGVPFGIIEYYEKNDLYASKEFDEYEKYIDDRITLLLK